VILISYRITINFDSISLPSGKRQKCTAFQNEDQAIMK